MSTIDIIILCILAIGAVTGAMKGFLKQLATLLGLVVGLLAAKALYAGLAERLSPVFGDSMTLAQVVAFIAIWLVVLLLFSLVAAMFTKMMEAVSLGGLNRLLGAVLGLLKYTLLIGVVICVLEYVDEDSKFINQTMKRESVLYYPIKDVIGRFFPMMMQQVLDEPKTHFNVIDRYATRRT